MLNPQNWLEKNIEVYKKVKTLFKNSANNEVINSLVKKNQVEKVCCCLVTFF